MAGQQPAGRPEHLLVDLLGLLAIADHAMDLQPQAETVLCPCGASADGFIRRAERLTEEFYELWARSLSFAPHAGPGSLERKLSSLIDQQYQVLQRALRVGLPEPGTARSEQCLGQLRSAAGELRPVRDELLLWILARTPA